MRPAHIIGCMDKNKNSTNSLLVLVFGLSCCWLIFRCWDVCCLESANLYHKSDDLKILNLMSCNQFKCFISPGVPPKNATWTPLAHHQSNLYAPGMKVYLLVCLGRLAIVSLGEPLHSSLFVLSCESSSLSDNVRLSVGRMVGWSVGNQRVS